MNFFTQFREFLLRRYGTSRGSEKHVATKKAGPGRMPGYRQQPDYRRRRRADGPGTLAQYDREVCAWLEGGRVGPRPDRFVGKEEWLF